jgi:hypothetical protein
MAITPKELYDSAVEMAGNIEDNFLELGKTLRQLQDKGGGELFQKFIVKTQIKRRKAYYLVEVSRIFDPLPISRNRLRKIGWTKLQLIGAKTTKDNVQEMLEMAENNTAQQLQAVMRGDKPVANSHCVLMYFSPKQYEELEEALLANGGTRSGRGIVDKEKALINALRKAKGAAKASGTSTNG